MSRGSWWRRRSKAERLAVRGDVPRLVRELEGHDWLVDRDGRAFDLAVTRRIAAVAALGRLDDPDAEKGLLLALDDRNDRVRRAAIDALRPAPSAHALTRLAQLAAGWRDPRLADLRKAALALLRELGDEVAAVEYTQVLIENRGRSPLSAAEAASVRELLSADSGPVAAIFAEHMAQRLGKGDEHERAIASQTLVAMGDVSVGPLILALEDPVRRRPAATALGELRDARAVPALIDILENSDPDTRVVAARALGAIRDRRALPALLHASGDPQTDVRDAAHEALDRMRSVVLAMLGAAGHVDEDATTHTPIGDAPGTKQPPAPTAEERSLMHRFLRRRLP